MTIGVIFGSLTTLCLLAIVQGPHIVSDDGLTMKYSDTGCTDTIWRSYRPSWAHLLFIETRVSEEESDTFSSSWTCLFTFLQSLQNDPCFYVRAARTKGPAAVEIRSSSSQPATQGFLDCVVALLLPDYHVIFQDSKQVLVWGGQVLIVWWVREHFPSGFCDCLRCQMCSVRLCQH